MPNLNCCTLNEKWSLLNERYDVRGDFPLLCQINGPVINIQFYSFNENCVQIKSWINCPIMQKNFLIKDTLSSCMMPNTKWPSWRFTDAETIRLTTRKDKFDFSSSCFWVVGTICLFNIFRDCRLSVGRAWIFAYACFLGRLCGASCKPWVNQISNKIFAIGYRLEIQ